MTSLTSTPEYSSLPVMAGRRATRALWAVAPIATPVVPHDLGHETEVVRALTLAVPISLALWAPLIWVAIQFL